MKSSTKIIAKRCMAMMFALMLALSPLSVVALDSGYAAGSDAEYLADEASTSDANDSKGDTTEQTNTSTEEAASDEPSNPSDDPSGNNDATTNNPTDDEDIPSDKPSDHDDAEDATEEDASDEATDEPTEELLFIIGGTPSLLAHTVSFTFPEDLNNESFDDEVFYFVDQGSAFDLLDGIVAADEIGADVTVFIICDGGFDIDAEWPYNAFTVVYGAVHPVTLVEFTRDREIVVTVPVVATSGEILVSGNMPGGAPYRMVDYDGHWHLYVDSGNINFTNWANYWAFAFANEITITGPVTIGPSMFGMFSQLSNLIAANGMYHLDTSTVTNMSQLFHNSTIPEGFDVSGWDTTAVTNMEMAFNSAILPTGFDISEWDTSAVENMAAMFGGATLPTKFDISNWNTGEVRAMNGMLSGLAMPEGFDISGWDTSKVTTMRAMFHHAILPTTFDISGWNTSNVTTMEIMFGEATIPVGFNISDWDVSAVTNMAMMFVNTTIPTGFDISRWTFNPGVGMGGIFGSITVLTELDLSGWDTRGITITNNIFSGASIPRLTLGEHFKVAGSLNLPARAWTYVGEGSIEYPRGNHHINGITSAQLFNHHATLDRTETWVPMPDVRLNINVYQIINGDYSNPIPVVQPINVPSEHPAADYVFAGRQANNTGLVEMTLASDVAQNAYFHDYSGLFIYPGNMAGHVFDPHGSDATRSDGHAFSGDIYVDFDIPGFDWPGISMDALHIEQVINGLSFAWYEYNSTINIYLNFVPYTFDIDFDFGGTGEAEDAFSFEVNDQRTAPISLAVRQAAFTEYLNEHVIITNTINDSVVDTEDITWSWVGFDEITFNTVGSFPVEVTATWTINPTFSIAETVYVHVIDIIAPIISYTNERVTFLTTETFANIEARLAEIIARAGITVSDNYDAPGSIQPQLTFLGIPLAEINWAQPAMHYPIRVSATDASGNDAMYAYIVIIVEAPTTGGGGGNGDDDVIGGGGSGNGDDEVIGGGGSGNGDDEVIGGGGNGNDDDEVIGGGDSDNDDDEVIGGGDTDNDDEVIDDGDDIIDDGDNTIGGGDTTQGDNDYDTVDDGGETTGDIETTPDTSIPDTETTPAPGGTDPDVAPIANDPTNILIASEDGTMFFEFDEDGVPLGAWTWDDETEMWIFDEDVPLAYFPTPPVGAGAVLGIASGLMPQTGLDSMTTTFGLLFVFIAVIAAGTLMLIKKESKKL